MIFLSSSFFVYPITSVSSANIIKTLHPMTITLMLLIICAVLYYDVLSIVAFFHFVITDKINRGFNQFYIANMIWVTIGLAITYLLFLVSFLVFDSRGKPEVAVVVAIHSLICLTLLVLMYFWSQRLGGCMPKPAEETAQQPVDEESGSEAPAQQAPTEQAPADAPQPPAQA